MWLIPKAPFKIPHRLSYPQALHLPSHARHSLGRCDACDLTLTLRDVYLIQRWKCKSSWFKISFTKFKISWFEISFTSAFKSSQETDVEKPLCYHYSDFIMIPMASQITSLAIVYSTVYSGASQRKYQSAASLAFIGNRWIPLTK